MKYSVNMCRQLRWTFLFAVCVLLTAPARAQFGTQDLGNAGLTDGEQRESALLWLDTFMTESDLLRPDDLAKIRQAVTNMSPSQLRQWLDQTKTLRAYVESDQWQETKLWLREFLRVQAIYSEKELQNLRNELVQADADRMLVILKRIQARHDSLVWMHQASQRNRQVEVEERDAYMAQRAVAAQAARGLTPRDVPLFGTGLGGTTGQKPSQGYAVPGPMIDSRSMSRAAVWAELWGPGFIIGF